MSQPFNPANFLRSLLLMNLPLILPLFTDPSVKNAFTEMMKTPEGQKKLKDGFLNHFKMFLNETLASAGLPPVATGGKKKARKSGKKMSGGKKRRNSAKKMSAGKKRRSAKKSPKKQN